MVEEIMEILAKTHGDRFKQPMSGAQLWSSREQRDKACVVPVEPIAIIHVQRPPMAESLAAQRHSAPRIARKINTAAESEVAMALLLVASGRARPPVVPEPQQSRLVLLPTEPGPSGSHHRCVLTRAPPDRHVADIVVLSGNLCDRDQPKLAGPSTANGTVKIDKPPSFRGPPTADGQRTPPTETVTVERLATDSSKVSVVGPARPANPIVCDDFGRQVPLCAAELDVIETYLDHVLREVLATPGSDSQAS